jgi:NADP+-dependent farnesol dehydrogenase
MLAPMWVCSSVVNQIRMERWREKVAVVTGANYGNGFAILKKLVAEGMTVVGLDLVTENIENFKNGGARVHVKKCDVASEEQVKAAFDWINDHFGGVDVLINNAGIFRDAGILQHETQMSVLSHVIDVNFTAVVRCAHYAFKSMDSRGGCGHIININSIHGHSVAEFDNSVQLGVYPGSKYGVTAATEVMRRELVNMKNMKIRVTSVSPGLVKTQIFKNASMSQAVEDSFLRHPHIHPQDIADNVVYLLSTPQHVNICEMTIRPTGSNI